MPLFPPALPTEWLLGSDALLTGAGGTVNTLSANQVYLVAITVRAPTTVSSMRTHIGTATPGKTDMGIYDLNGNLLCHTGAITNVAASANTNALSGGNYLLAPGNYYLALANDNGTDQYSRSGTLNIPGSLGTIRFATTMAVAGVLPATLGAILAPGGPIPVWCAVTVNGLP